MDDFLHNLRMSKDRRFERGRKPYDSQNYRKGRTTDNRKGNYRKPQGVEQVTNLLNEKLPDLENRLIELVEQQKRVAAASERHAMAEERKASALELLVDVFQRAGGAPWAPEQPNEVEGPQPSFITNARVETETQVGETPSDDAIIDLIQTMRARGLSYSKIADDLNAQNIPTTSGRGKWRGPMVSKVCRETE